MFLLLEHKLMRVFTSALHTSSPIRPRKKNKNLKTGENNDARYKCLEDLKFIWDCDVGWLFPFLKSTANHLIGRKVPAVMAAVPALARGSDESVFTDR